MGIWLSIFIGTMERCANISFIALLVDIDASGLWTASGFVEISGTDTSVHFSILTINIIAH